MNLLKKIDHYLLTNRPVLWRTKVHYFVLFSLILGNVAAVFIRELLENEKGIALVFGAIFLGFSTLFWIVSQARNKIKHYRFWDEVLTFGVYMCCAASLFVNFLIMIKASVADGAVGYLLSTFVLTVSVLVYLTAHTNLRVILGVLLLHFVMMPLTLLVTGEPFYYIVTLFILFPLFYFFSDNSTSNRFVRFYVIPHIPLCMPILYFYFEQPAWKIGIPNYEWLLFLFLFMIILTIFGSAFIVKHNVEPSREQ